jgi:hypothetical protein
MFSFLSASCALGAVKTISSMGNQIHGWILIIQSHAFCQAEPVFADVFPKQNFPLVTAGFKFPRKRQADFLVQGEKKSRRLSFFPNLLDIKPHLSV